MRRNIFCLSLIAFCLFGILLSFAGCHSSVIPPDATDSVGESESVTTPDSESSGDTLEDHTDTTPYYTITFDSCGGSPVDSQSIREGNPVRRPETPQRDGYSLRGWYKTATAASADAWNFDTDRVTANITLYAGWDEVKEPDSEHPNFTESLVFTKNGNVYTVTGVGDDTRVIVPAEYEGLPVTAIGESAFARKAITYICLPDSITRIELNAFHNCSDLEEIVIGENSQLTSIGRNAFSGNHSLKNIYLPAGLTEIGDSAFNNCGGLNTITVAAENAVYSSEGNNLIEKATHTIIRGSNRSVIPESVTEIAVAAFRQTTGITELIIPKTVNKIGNYFIADSNITTIRFDGTETEWNAIEKSAIMWNYGNRNVTLIFTEDDTPVNTDHKILVVYFSCTDNTKGIAEKIANATDGTLYRIIPAVAYTSSDLEYWRSDSRASMEQADPNSRPAVASQQIEDFDEYDTIFIGYPIWHGQAPKIMYTFLESYDMTGKTVIPFCTSASSPMGSSAANLQTSAQTATWITGKRIDSSESQNNIDDWIEQLNLKPQTPDQGNILYLTIGDVTLTATLVDNSSTQALKALLANGPLTIDMRDYANFEKVGSLGTSLPTNDEYIVTEPGDLILYVGSAFVIYYDTNSYSFTRLGKIDHITQAELMEILGDGNVTVTLSLTK